MYRFGNDSFPCVNIAHIIATHGFQLLQREQAVSVASCTLGSSADSKSTYYVVGTALVNPNEKEPSVGRILVLQVTNSKCLYIRIYGMDF